MIIINLNLKKQSLLALDTTDDDSDPRRYISNSPTDRFFLSN
jgi:hypothetical protein